MVQKPIVSFNHLFSGTSLLTSGSCIHSIQSSAVEKLYDYNIDGPSQCSPRDVMAARLDLTMQLDEWCQSLEDPMEVIEYCAGLWRWHPKDPRRWSVILSTYYYFTKLLINAPVLTMALAEAQKHWPWDIPSSMLHDSVIQVLRDNLKSGKNLQKLVRGICLDGRPFIQENALWFLCNYSSISHRCPMTISTQSLTNRGHYSVYDFPPRLRHTPLSQRSRKRRSRCRPPYERSAIAS